VWRSAIRQAICLGIRGYISVMAAWKLGFLNKRNNVLLQTTEELLELAISFI
jgi:hypothetical protein